MSISAADLMVTFKADTKDAEAGIKRVNSGINSFAKAAAKGTALAAAGVGAAGFFAGKIAIPFGREMANVNSILQGTDKQIAQVSDDVLQMALRTAQAPTVLAAGLYQVVSSGFSNIKDAEKILEISANAATAGLTTTEVAARAVTGTLNAYGLGVGDAQRVSDVFFQTVNDGVLSFDQLANNLGHTTSQAANLNVPVEQLGAAYAQMTLNNVNASAAETQISALLRSAVNPTTALTKAIAAHGYASAEALIKSEGLPGYLKFLDETAGGSATALGDLTGNVDAANAAMILSKNHVKNYNGEVDKMNHSTEGAGATQKALAKQMQSASFQIQRMKVALQVLAITGFGIIAPIVTRAASAMTSFLSKGVIPFTKIIGMALKGGFAFDKMIKQLPQPLQRSAHAIGVVTEALGDMWRRGFSKNEMTQAVHGLQAIGQEIDQGAHFVANIVIDSVVSLAGWLYDHKGDIWGGIKSLIGWGAGKFSDAITATISGAITLAGDIKDAAGDIWGWLKRKIMGGQVGDATGGPAAVNANNIDFGTVAVTAAVKLGGVIAAIAGNIWGWVKGQLIGGAGSVSQDPASPMFGATGQSIDVGTAILTGLAELGGELKTVATDVKGWITTNLHIVKNQVIDIGHVTLEGDVEIKNRGGDEQASRNWVDRFVANVKQYGGPVRDAGIWVSTQLASGAGYAAGAAIGGFVDAAGAIVLGLVAAIKDPAQIAKIGVGINDALRLAFNATAWSFGPITGVATAFYSALKSGFDIATPDLSFITDKLFGGISAGASQDPASPMYGGGATAGLFANLGTTLQLGLSAAIQSFTPDVGDVGTKITTALGTAWVDALAAFTTAFKPDFGFIGTAITTALESAKPTLPSWLTDLGWITEKINALTAKLGELTALAGQVTGAGSDVVNPRGENGGGGGKGYQNLSFPIAPNIDGIPTGGGGQQALPAMTLPAVDATAFTASLASATAAAQAFAAQTFTAKLTGDNGQFAQAYTAAFGWGTVFAAQTFQSTLSGDNGPMATAYTNAFGWGNTFAAQNFQATLSADDGPAAAAYTEAFGWGSIWASQVFTASFSVDVSGLYAAQAVAYQVAANIAAIMPHSPAKRGPLSKPIRFSFIADAARRDLSGLGNEIEGYLGTNRHQVGARGGRSRGGNHITVNALKSAELIRLIKDAETGGSFARGLGRELGLSGGF